LKKGDLLTAMVYVALDVLLYFDVDGGGGVVDDDPLAWDSVANVEAEERDTRVCDRSALSKFAS